MLSLWSCSEWVVKQVAVDTSLDKTASSLKVGCFHPASQDTTRASKPCLAPVFCSSIQGSIELHWCMGYHGNQHESRQQDCSSSSRARYCSRFTIREIIVARGRHNDNDKYRGAAFISRNSCIFSLSKTSQDPLLAWLHCIIRNTPHSILSSPASYTQLLPARKIN